MKQAVAPVAVADDPAQRVLQVGDWLVDASLNQIVRGDQVVRLEPKAMAVLVHLARHPQQVVSRDELLSAVWPGLVVSDNALTQVVIKLRKALGDTAHEPTYVQAVAKKGYRLVAEVGQPAATALESAAVGEAPSLLRQSAALQWVAATLIVLLVAVGIAWSVRPQPPVATMPPGNPARPELPTVLVEPFQEFDAATDQRMIGRALTADLVTDLSKLSGLWVVGAAQPPADNRARPRYVLSGSVEQRAGRLRVNVLLTDTEANRHLWSERFERGVEHLFDVQDELLNHVLKVLPVKVSEAETMRLAQRSTRNLAAYQSFLRAQAMLLVRRPAQNNAARGLYWDAIGRDPAFARAYAGLALTYALDWQQGWSSNVDESALVRATEFAQTALRMRPDMPEAHWVLAFVHTQQRRFLEALQHLDEALRLSPSYADGHALKAGIFTYIGQPARSIELMQDALRLNADAGSLYFLLLGRAYYFLGDFEQARFNLTRALERNSENVEARVYLVALDWQAGNLDAALWEAGEIRSLEPTFSADAWLANYPLADATQRSWLRTAMREAGL